MPNWPFVGEPRLFNCESCEEPTSAIYEPGAEVDCSVCGVTLKLPALPTWHPQFPAAGLE